MIDDKQIEQDLQHWAAWAICRADAGLGWPSTTIGYRLMIEGAEGAAIRGTPGSKVIDSDERAELMDKAINRLPGQMKDVVILSYLTYQSNEACANALKCSVAKYYQLLSSAKGRITAWLEGREDARSELVRLSGRESIADHC